MNPRVVLVVVLVTALIYARRKKLLSTSVPLPAGSQIATTGAVTATLRDTGEPWNGNNGFARFGQYVVTKSEYCNCTPTEYETVAISTYGTPVLMATFGAQSEVPVGTYFTFAWDPYQNYPLTVDSSRRSE